ncbi:hypothetical protein PNI0199_00346 [Streptococcus pneumoniae PNI0199]|nr:hypothetical protein PNI0199_00346 [Streptococcus pneumoniae PNI0199]
MILSSPTPKYQEYHKEHQFLEYFHQQTSHNVSYVLQVYKKA